MTKFILLLRFPYGMVLRVTSGNFLEMFDFFLCGAGFLMRIGRAHPRSVAR